MKATLTISLENAAFEDNAGIELARILNKLAKQIEDWPRANAFEIGCRDVNGNKVGQLIVK